MSDTKNATDTPVVDVDETSPVENQDANAPQPTQEPTENTADTFSREYVENLRKENASYRVKAKEASESESKHADLVQQLGKALGFVQEDDAPVDAEKMIAEATAERDTYRQQLADLRRENAITKAATAHNADLSMLDPYLRGTGALDALDPADSDYASQVEEIVKESVSNNPKLAATVAMRASGVDNGGTSAESPISREKLADMFAKGQYAEVNRLQAAGKLNHLI